MDSLTSDLMISIMIVGEASTGKTSLLKMFLDNMFDENTKPTIGNDFNKKVVTVKNKRVEVKFWDTAGQEKYRAISSMVYKNAQGVILVYDITKRSTFERITEWINMIRTNCKEHIKIILIGNKNDLMDTREVSIEEGNDLAKKNGFYFIETSAKTNKDNSVFSAFDIIIESTVDLVEKIDQEKEKELLGNLRPSLIQLNPEKKKEKTCCN